MSYFGGLRALGFGLVGFGASGVQGSASWVLELAFGGNLGDDRALELLGFTVGFKEIRRSVVSTGQAGSGICTFGCSFEALRSTYSLHCSPFLGLPFRILNIESPKKRNYNGDYR